MSKVETLTQSLWLIKTQAAGH